MTGNGSTKQDDGVPVLLTNTLSVGRVHDGVVSWMIYQLADRDREDAAAWSSPSDDEWLTDIRAATRRG
jgi:hypothetical protein